MLTKISLVLLIILNIYVIAVVDKASRQDIWANLKLIPHRIKHLFPKAKIKVRDDDKEDIMPVPKTIKMDFSEKCKRDRVPCDDGKQSLKCYHEVKYSKARCMTCECSICVNGKCPPAKRG
jgi:hypothetical protein